MICDTSVNNCLAFHKIWNKNFNILFGISVYKDGGIRRRKASRNDADCPLKLGIVRMFRDERWFYICLGNWINHHSRCSVWRMVYGNQKGLKGQFLNKMLGLYADPITAILILVFHNKCILDLCPLYYYFDAFSTKIN